MMHSIGTQKDGYKTEHDTHKRFNFIKIGVAGCLYNKVAKQPAQPLRKETNEMLYTNDQNLSRSR